ncbi:DUF6455 family protein [Gymnodinialimonas sp. 57CJ19]|uniref:DUF6455 family protein n=1 Tax=Gymnodinialimonas sp. 57CJ19 TaxID=3138498 RepID=UPI0031345014
MTKSPSTATGSGEIQTETVSPKRDRIHSVATKHSSRFEERTARSVAIAKTMARLLDVDLFDEHRLGRFNEIVQNCDVCFLHEDCYQQTQASNSIRATPLHCRNRHNFAPAKAVKSTSR